MTVLSLTENELEFFNEVSVLMNEKYPEMREKFGLWRKHQHFELKKDEVFHETSNSVTKESTLRIINKKDLPVNAFVSTWTLSDHGPLAATWCCDDSPITRP